MEQFDQPTRSQVSLDMTQHNFGSVLGPVTATGGIWVEFSYVQVPIKTVDASKNGSVETRLVVMKQPKGDRLTKSIAFITEDEAQRRYPQEYAMFKQYQTVPETGTPLSELPGISRSEIARLEINGLRSIEDLVEISPDIVQQLGLDAVRAQKVAKAWDQKRQMAREVVSAADVESKLQMQMAAMQKQIEALQASNERLAAEKSALARMNGKPATNFDAPTPVDDSFDDEDQMASSNFLMGSERGSDDDDLVGGNNPLGD